MNVYCEHEGSYKVCMSCDHRLADKRHCDIDGHYIGYVASFDCWCRHWTDREYKRLFDRGLDYADDERYVY